MKMMMMITLIRVTTGAVVDKAQQCLLVTRKRKMFLGY